MSGDGGWVRGRIIGDENRYPRDYNPKAKIIRRLTRGTLFPARRRSRVLLDPITGGFEHSLQPIMSASKKKKRNETKPILAFALRSKSKGRNSGPSEHKYRSCFWIPSAAILLCVSGPDRFKSRSDLLKLAHAI